MQGIATKKGYIKKDYPVKPCKVCGTPFKPHSPQNVYCSIPCVKKNADLIKVPSGVYDLASGTVGAISEILVAIDLMKKGWDVYRGLSPASYCDLIAIKGEATLKLEVRTGFYYHRKNKGKTLNYPTKRTNGKTVVVYTFSDNKIHYIGTEL